LRFFDAETLAPLTGTVQLWRLHAPATRYWEAGDQLQLQGELKDGLWLVPEIPPGEYRTYATFGRAGGRMEPSFQVEGKHTLVERFVFMPQNEHAYLQLVNLNGFALNRQSNRKIEIKKRGKEYLWVDPQTPPWLQQRWPKGNGVLVSTGMGGGFSSGQHQPWKNPFLQGDEINLGVMEGLNRERNTKYHFQLRADQGPTTQLYLQATGATTYTALFADALEIAPRVVFPGGEIPVDLSQAIAITSTAVPIVSASSSVEAREQFANNSWRDATLRIRINLDGYLPFELTWSPNDGPLPELPLQKNP